MGLIRLMADSNCANCHKNMKLAENTDISMRSKIE